MATRLGVLRARGQSRGARLPYGQQHLCSSIINTNNCWGGGTGAGSSSSVRSIAGLSSSSRTDGIANNSNDAVVGRSNSGPNTSTFALRVLRAPCGRQQSRLPSSPCPGGHCKAAFSTRPFASKDQEKDQEAVPGSSPTVLAFDGVSKKDRLAKLDDGDKYEDFADLRLTEADKFFPEGLAGAGQGALHRATSRNTSTALLTREASDALIHSLDDFTGEAEASAGGEEAKASRPFGIEGTSSKRWRETCQKRKYGNRRFGGGEGRDVTDGESSTEGGGGATGGSGAIDEIVGDVRAAAAEGAAAAAAAAEAVKAAAATAAGGGADGIADGKGSEDEGEEGEEQKPVLGSGPIWEEMKALAQSKRKPLKGIRRVTVRSGQRSYLLTGRRGSGKSCALNQAVLHARSTGWIVLFVPDARNLVQKGIYCQPSPVLEGLYDLPIQSLKRLKTLRDAHGDQLKGISIKDPEVLARHEGAKTLLDVMDLGLADQELAGTAHYDVMRELLATTEAKVMLAIDEYNELFQMSHWHFGDDKLEAPHLTATIPLLPPLVSTGTGLAFKDEALASLANPEAAGSKTAPPARAKWLGVETGAACLPPPPANGIVVCAVSGRYPPIKKIRKKQWTPFEAVAGRLANAVSVPVEPYTRREFLRVVKHYARVEEVVNEPLSDMEMAKLHAKSDRFPEHVFEVCQHGRYHTVVSD